MHNATISRVFGVLVASYLIAFAALAATPTSAPPPVVTPIKIGVTTSLTGAIANFGVEQQRGMKMWEKDVNNRGELLGRPVELVLYDDASSAANVTQLYEKLITQDKVDFLISPYTSNLTLAAAAVAEKYGVPMVSVASSADIWNRGYRNVFGLYTPAHSNMDPVIDLAKERGLKTIAVVYLDDDFPRHVAEGVRQRAAADGLTVVLDQQYSNDLTQMPALAQKVAAANADVVVVASYMDDAVAFAQAAKAAGVKPKLMAYSGAPALQEFGQRLGVANIQGVLSTVQWSRDVRVPGGFDLAFRYEREYNMYPSYDAAGGYAAGQVLEAAIRLAGTTDHDKVRDELAVLKFRSILGNYRVDATGLQTAKSTYLVQWQDDHISLVYPPDVARWKLLYPYPG
jgi:branched-chain amino acid transport system substrate-binding protein